MSTRRRSARPSIIEVVKDLLLFGVGLALIIRQGWLVSKDDFNWWAMAFGIGLTQAPGAMAMITLIRTGGQSSPDPPVAPSSPSPLPLPNGSGADV